MFLSIPSSFRVVQTHTQNCALCNKRYLICKHVLFGSIGACWPDNEEFQETNEYKQVAAYADSYLKQSSYRMELSDKSLYPVCYNLNSIIKQ